MSQSEPRPCLLEVCVGSVSDAVAAAEAGADRIELCSALELGGLTPSAGTINEVVRRVPVPVVVMLRPRAGGFCYQQADFDAMLRDAHSACEAGASGIVFGILHQDGSIDVPRCRRLVEAAGDRETVFHRAFDVIADPLAALQQLIDLGITRILTSGGQPTASEGLPLLRHLVEQAGQRIEILPGGGLHEDNFAYVLRESGCRQLHMGLASTNFDPSLPSTSPIDFRALPEDPSAFRGVDSGRIRRMRALLST